VNRTILLPIAALFLVASSACDEGNKGKDPQAPPSTASPAAQAPIADEDLAVKADFEEEAERTITATTYKQELDALENEVNGS
jgi:hypothetical protein